MSKFNINVAHELYPFKDAIGDEKLFVKICNDTKAFIGREEVNVKSKLSGVTITEKCILTSKEGHKLALPLNNLLSILLRFGMQITKLDNAMDNRKVDKEGNVVSGMQSELPRIVQSWFHQTRTEWETKGLKETVALASK